MEKKDNQNKNKISLIMVVYHEEALIRRALESAKDVVDEILVLHDGPCKDNTLKIAREYTHKIIENKENVGLPGPIIPILLRKAKGPWILKFDADEFLSKRMKENLRRLAENEAVNGYTFIWPYWDGKKHITKNWPRKPSLYRKSKISYFGFPHWDDPKIEGKVVNTSYILEHRPKHGTIPTVKFFREKILGRYARIHAEYSLRDFKKFDSFQYKEKDFPFYFKLRRDYPLLSLVPITLAAAFRNLFSKGAWKEGWPAIAETIQDLIYYPYVNYLIFQLKRGKIKNKYLKD